MRTLSLHRYELALATLRRWARERDLLLTEVDIPAMDRDGQAVRIASLSVRGHLETRTLHDLIADAQRLRARCVLDHDGEQPTLSIQIARELDAREEAALAEEYQGRLRLASGGGL